MRLISLELKNWRGYDECQIDFPDGLIGIGGPNGAGKTTLAEAIGWTLYGRLRPQSRVGDVRRQRGEGPASAELLFQLEDTVYRVHRIAQGEAHLWIGEGEEPETTGVMNTTARVAAELGMTWEVFERTVFAQQKDVAALSPELSGRQRRDHVERLLGLARFKRAAEEATREAKAIEAELRGRKAQAPDLAELRGKLREAEKRAEKGSPAVAEAEIERDKATAAVKDGKSAVDAERERVRQAELLSRDKSHASKLASDVRKNVAALKNRIEEREAKRKRLSAITSDATRSDDATETARRWDELEKAHRELESARKGLGGLNYDEAHLEAAKERVEDLRRKRDRATEQLSRTGPKVEALKTRVAALRAAERAGDRTERETELRSLRQVERKLENRIAILESELAHDRSHIEEVADAGAETPCPVCHRPYGSDYDSILAGYHERIKQAETALPELQRELARAGAARSKAEDARDRAGEAERDLGKTSGPSKLATAQQHLDRDGKRLAQLEADLSDLKKSLPPAERELKDLEDLSAQQREKRAVVQEREARFRECTGALGVEKYAKREHQHGAAESKRLAGLAKEARKLEAEVAAEGELDDELKQQRSVAAKAKGEEKRVSSELDEIGLDAKLLGKLERALEKAEKQRDAAMSRLQEAKLEAKGRSGEVRDLRARVKEASEAQEEIRRREVEHRQHTVAADLLNRYRDHEAQRAWPHLEQGASAILAAATDGRYADIKLSEDYKIHIVDRGEEHRLDRFSGGEQDLANLCLRLAIAQWVARERGVQLSFLVLDEVFGSQDDERRPRLLAELRELAGRFRQVLIITHNPEIADLCDSRIEVSLPEPGRSVASAMA